eukprot:1002953-Prorocentrum_minimum.AAC.1
MVALTGAHTLGRARRGNFGFGGQLSPDPRTFSNDYFVNLLSPRNGVLRMPSDRILVGTAGATPVQLGWGPPTAASFDGPMYTLIRGLYSVVRPCRRFHKTKLPGSLSLLPTTPSDPLASYPRPLPTPSAGLSEWVNLYARNNS